MQLTRLRLWNFLNVELAEVNFSTAPVHIVIGPNAAGKSAIRDAILFALTGKCRGVTTKRSTQGKLDYGALVRDGAAGLTVRLEATSAEDKTLAWERTDKAVDLPADLDLTGVEDVLALALDPWGLVKASQAERAKLVKKLFGDAGPNRQLVLDAWGFADVACSEDDAPASDAMRAVVQRSAVDLDAALKQAEAERLALSRQIADLAVSKTQPDRTIEIDGEPVDVAEWPLAKAREQLEALLRNQGSLQEQLKGVDDAEAKRQRVKTLRKRLTALDDAGKRLAEFGAKEAEARKQKEAAEQAIKELDKALAERQAKVALLKDFSRHLNVGLTSCLAYAAIECPVFTDVNRGATAKMIESRLDEIHADLSRDEDRMVKAETDRDEAEMGLEAIAKQIEGYADVPGERKTLAGQLTETERELAAADKIDAEAIQGQLAELGTRAIRGRALIAAVEGRQRDLAEYEAKIKRRDELQGQHGLWDQAVKLMKPGGAVHAAYNAGEADAGIDTGQASAWDCQVRLGADGTLLLNGRPIELASASQQWRAGVLVADALARKAALGFLVLDQADVLDLENRQLLMNFVAARREEYDTIIVLATEGDVAREPSSVDWCQKWVVEDGRVLKIEATAPVGV